MAKALRPTPAPVPMPPLRAGTSQERLVLGVRPGHVRLADDSPVRGEVFGVEYMGARQVITVDTAAGRLRLRTSNNQIATVGEDLVHLATADLPREAASRRELLGAALAVIDPWGVGVAGGLGDGVAVGDVVIGDRFLQHDMDASG